MFMLLKPVLRLLSLNSGSAHPNTATAQFPEQEGKVLVCGLGRCKGCYYPRTRA